MWFGLLRVVHLAALFLFSAKRKEKIFPTRTTEEPLVSGNDSMFTTSIIQTESRRVSVGFTRENHLFTREGAPVGFSDLAGSTAGFVRWWRLDLLFIRPG